jgi:hypothetical protein
MRSRKKPVPGLDPARKFPYFKVQYWDDTIAAWRDIQKAFRSMDQLDLYVEDNFDRSQRTRVWKIAGYRSRSIFETRDAPGIPEERDD